MTQPQPTARLAYLTEADGIIALNLMIDEQLQIVTLKPGQLVNMVADGAKMMQAAYFNGVRK